MSWHCPRSIHMINFTYEGDIKIKNKHVAGISRTFYLSTETTSRPPHSPISWDYPFKPVLICYYWIKNGWNLNKIALDNLTSRHQNNVATDPFSGHSNNIVHPAYSILYSPGQRFTVLFRWNTVLHKLKLQGAGVVYGMWFWLRQPHVHYWTFLQSSPYSTFITLSHQKTSCRLLKIFCLL
jgi:hypothetical protein